MRVLVPEGIVFVGDTPVGIEYENLTRACRDLAAALPSINTIEALPMALDDVAAESL